MHIPDDLARHVRDALTHYWDPAFLQTCELANLLPSDDSVVEGPHVQRVLRQALEALKPPPTIPLHQTEWLPYRIVKYRYLDRQSVAMLSDRLALSPASVYRHQQQAIEALTDILWKQACLADTAQEAEGSDSVSAETEDEAIRDAVEHMGYSREPVPLTRLLSAVHSIFSSLAKERGLELVMELSSAQGITAFGDPAALHQVFLCALTAVSTRAPRTSTIRVDVAPLDASHCLVRIGCGIALPSSTCDEKALALCRRLLRVCGGELWIDDTTSKEALFTFSLATERPDLIIVVEDNEDTAALYQRYLQPSGCLLRFASNGGEFWETMARDTPSLVILDVLMPKEDGWMILQRLKTLPETADIPIIVYSVVPQPSLARALGASIVLQKPIEEKVLLSAVNRVLHHPDTLV